MTELRDFKRNHDWENDEKPYLWVNRRFGAGSHAHMRVWVEKNVRGFDMEKWTVRKEEFDDSRRGQHMPTTISTHSSKEDARKSAVEWMRNF